MAAGEYPGSTLYPASSSNYLVASRPASNPINKIIIHVTQGSWAGAINWFQDPKAQVSVHYTVRPSDGAVGQAVREKDIAWHAVNWLYNQTSIGIEHEGFVSDSNWFTEAMYRSSPSSRPTYATSTVSRKTGAT
jgi:N-acetyl-anhydromuramyl-L-alanine amidase AmpD